MPFCCFCREWIKPSEIGETIKHETTLAVIHIDCVIACVAGVAISDRQERAEDTAALCVIETV